MGPRSRVIEQLAGDHARQTERLIEQEVGLDLASDHVDELAHEVIDHREVEITRFTLQHLGRERRATFTVRRQRDGHRASTWDAQHRGSPQVRKKPVVRGTKGATDHGARDPSGRRSYAVQHVQTEFVHRLPVCRGDHPFTVPSEGRRHLYACPPTRRSSRSFWSRVRKTLIAWSASLSRSSSTALRTDRSARSSAPFTRSRERPDSSVSRGCRASRTLPRISWRRCAMANWRSPSRSSTPCFWWSTAAG